MKNGSNGRLKIAVIGAGRMGLNHLRIYSMLRGVDVVAVVDPIIERARSAADPLGAKACTSLSELPDDLDGASVVVPTSHHLEVSLPLLEAGVSCLSGESFGAYGQGYIRFSYANSYENLMAAVERIKIAVANRATVGSRS